MNESTRETIRPVLVSDFDFLLPPESIAQRPVPRGTSRLMTLRRGTGEVGHLPFSAFPSLLKGGDLLVVNDTRVLPVRLHGISPSGKRTEFLLVRKREKEGDVWECLSRAGSQGKPGSLFRFGARLTGEVVERRPDGQLIVKFNVQVEPHLEEIGSAPLPPYVRRPGGVADERDAVDYQTVFAREPGAIAAPTAGLHFTQDLLEEIRQRGVEVASITLHVGIGTFQPVKVEALSEHVMHPERGEISSSTAEKVNAAKESGRRVVAVGTTSVRALEASARDHAGRIAPGPFETRLFLVPGAPFLVVDALLTNFHLPKSTLLMLVAAYSGRDNVLAAYREAVRSGYRFFSYGDAMFIA